MFKDALLIKDSKENPFKIGKEKLYRIKMSPYLGNRLQKPKRYHFIRTKAKMNQIQIKDNIQKC